MPLPRVRRGVGRPGKPAADGAPDPRIRRTWWLFAGSFFTLGFLMSLRLIAGQPRPMDWFLALLVVTVGLAAVLHRQAVHALEMGRRTEAESFARILSGLSRSVSPDAIVEAIVEELAVTTGADHVAVVRRRVDARVLEATLITSRAGVAATTTVLPISDLEDPPEEPGVGRTASERHLRVGLVAGVDADSPAGRVAERIAARVRTVFGLGHTLVAPLRSEAGLVGAIVLSRRRAEPWPASAARILAGAAGEASAALARAYSHQAAEARATTDALTGLPNRHYFEEFCGLLARRRRSEDAVGVLMIDIDHFKAINDRHGHAVGDRVLRTVAGAIVAAVREHDVPARFGGEEFVVLLRNPGPDVALEVGERVRQAVGALDLRALGVEAVTVSVGVAVGDSPERSVDELVADADRALYAAKRAGRDRVFAA